MEQKSRKTYQGAKNNKEQTMTKLLEGVGIVLEEKGYTGLNATNIAKAAQVDRKLIKLYFGSLDNLIDTYIRSRDYWLTETADTTAPLKDDQNVNTKDVLEKLLIDQLDNFRKNREMQKAVTWQISEKSNIMSEITRNREKVSALFFPLAEKELADKNIDIRAISSLLVAGIYYLVLHAEHTDSTVCDIELDDNGFDRVKSAIKSILNATYSKNDI